MASLSTLSKVFRASRAIVNASSAPRIRALVTTTATTARTHFLPSSPLHRHQRALCTTHPASFFASAGRDGEGYPPSIPKWMPPSADRLDEQPVLIVGAGNMGRRIALVWASALRPVTLYDTSQSALDSAIEYITDNLGAYCASRGTHPGHVFGTTDARIAATTGRHEGLPSETEAADIELHSGSKGPWLAIDCLPDVLPLKIQVLAQLEDLLPPDCILSSSSACLSTSELTTHLRADIAARLLNTHYFVPPRNRMVELMSSSRTDGAIFPFLAAQMRRVGFTPITVPAHIQSPGLIFNRIWGACKRETLAVLSEGVASPGDVDALFRDFFHAEKGPCERMDEVGLDTVERVETHALEKRPEPGKQHVLRWLREGCTTKGKLGEKTGDGLFTREEREELRALHQRLRFEAVEETQGA